MSTEEPTIANEQIYMDDWKAYPMREPFIAKVVVDICTGGGDEKQGNYNP